MPDPKACAKCNAYSNEKINTVDPSRDPENWGQCMRLAPSPGDKIYEAQWPIVFKEYYCWQFIPR